MHIIIIQSTQMSNQYCVIDDESDDEYQDQCCFEFSDLRNKVVVELGKYDPKTPYYCVSNGINLQGKCLNQSCIAFEKRVWIQKKYGVFDIGYERDNAYCPCCNQEASDVNTLGYMRAKVTFDGKRLIDQQSERYKDVQQERNGKFVKFPVINKNDISTWTSLRVTVEQLK